MSVEIDTVTGELVPATNRTLFLTDDPTEVLAAARDVAEALKGALEQGGMVQRIGGNEHVKIDGWQTLGSMLGIAPYVVWSRPIEDGWEARAEARTADGRTVGAAEAMVTHKERNWRNSDEYALRSMAQTRAMSKALRGPLGFIITLAGKSATPAEEIEDEFAYGPPASKRDADNLERALALLMPDTETGQLVTRFERDAGDYLPKVVARAIMLMAASRPSHQEVNAESTDTVTGASSPAEDTPSDPTEPPEPDDAEEAPPQ
jgi:hypothetical protein